MGGSKMRGAKDSNPYSGRGLDKFATLNADLAAKRESVARKTGTTRDLVRFKHSGGKWLPVMVRGKRDRADSVVPAAKSYEGDKPENDLKEFSRIAAMDFSSEPSWNSKGVDAVEPKDASADGIGLIILLFSVVFFGKLWAICCTCAWWYFLSNFTLDGNANYWRRISGKKSRITVLIDVESKKKETLILNGFMLGSNLAKPLKYK